MKLGAMLSRDNGPLPSSAGWRRFQNYSLLGIGLLTYLSTVMPRYTIAWLDGGGVHGVFCAATFGILQIVLLHDLARVRPTDVLDAKIYNEKIKSFANLYNFGATFILAALTLRVVAFQEGGGFSPFFFLGIGAALFINGLARKVLNCLADERPEAYLSSGGEV